MCLRRAEDLRVEVEGRQLTVSGWRAGEPGSGRTLAIHRQERGKSCCCTIRWLCAPASFSPQSQSQSIHVCNQYFSLPGISEASS